MVLKRFIVTTSLRYLNGRNDLGKRRIPMEIKWLKKMCPIPFPTQVCPSFTP